MTVVANDEWADHAKWLDTHDEMAGTPEYVQRSNRFLELDAQRKQQPWTAQLPHSIDYGAPEEQVRSDVAGVTDPRMRNVAMNKWGDKYVENETAQAPLSQFAGDAFRAVAKGVPFVGSWLDEANAATAAGMGRPGGYDEAIAYQRARDRAFEKKYPATNFGLNMAGGMATPLITGPKIAANVLFNTLGGAVSGAGEGEGGWDMGGLVNRGINAATGGAVSGTLSSILGPVAKFVTRFNRSSITPAVEAAANRLGVSVPFFLRSANPEAQAAGQRATQSAIGSDLDTAYRQLPQQLHDAAGRLVQGATGASIETAPRVAGGVMESAYPRVAADIGSRMRAAGQDTASMFPPGHVVDLPQHRGAYGNLVAERARDMNPTNPAGGLQWTENLVTAPGGVAWPTVDRYTSWLGRQLRRPDPMQPRVGNTQELEPLYASLMRDREAAVHGVAGQPGVDRMLANRTEQNALAQLRDQIRTAVEGRQPEQLINQVQGAASTKGGGTRLGTFANMTNALTPPEQQITGGGVLANMINQTAVKPPVGTLGPDVMNSGAVASAINRLVPGARDTLFAPGSPLGTGTDALAQLGQRIAQVSNAYGHVGSARSMSDRMATAATGPLAGAAGAGGLSWLAHVLNLPPQVSGPLAAAAVPFLTGATTNTLLNKAVPYAAMHGVNPLLQLPARAGANILPQVAAQQITERQPFGAR